MKQSRLIVIFTVATTCGFFAPLLPPAATASEIALLGVYQQLTPTLVNSTANTAFTPGGGYGAGLQLAASLVHRLELELGAGYGLRAWNDSLTGALQMPAIDCLGGFRYRVFHFLALDAGAYYSAINSGSRVSYIATTDYGAYAGAQLTIRLFSGTSLLLGGRYLYGLANVSLVGGSLSFRGYEGLAGLQFNLNSHRR